MRRRSRYRTGGWTLVIGLLLAGLWLANTVCPRGSRRIHIPSVPAKEALSEGVVKEVIDGDTLLLACGVKVRLQGIDAPEYGRFGHDASTRSLRELVSGGAVHLDYGAGRKMDDYGRLLAFVTNETGTLVNASLLARGWAWMYRMNPSSPRWEPFLAAQRSALEGGEGIWSRLAAGEGSWQGSRVSRIFHEPDCPYGKKVSIKNRVAFERLPDAYLQGYAPCRTCIEDPLKGR